MAAVRTGRGPTIDASLGGPNHQQCRQGREERDQWHPQVTQLVTTNSRGISTPKWMVSSVDEPSQGQTRDIFWQLGIAASLAGDKEGDRTASVAAGVGCFKARRRRRQPAQGALPPLRGRN